MITVRMTDSKETFTGLWLMAEQRLVLAVEGKVVTSVPISSLEVEVHGQWYSLDTAWKERKISFLAMVVALKGQL